MPVRIDIVMVTFNHGKYIGEAIESVVNQICDFDYRLIIANDCSTDCTTEICEEYVKRFPNKILLITQPVNVGLVKNYDAAFKACTADYIGILEGDDVWTDSYKLQKQIDILIANPSCGLVHTGFDVKEQNGQMRRANLNLRKEKAEGFLYEAVMRDEIAFCPLTVVFRRSLLTYVDYDFCILNNTWTIDAFLWPEMAKQAQVRYIPDVTGLYRRIQSAATSTRNPEKLIWYYRTGLAMKLYYLDKYPIPSMAKEDLEQSFLKTLIYKLIQSRAAQLAINYSYELRPRNRNEAVFKFIALRSSLHWVFRLFENIFQFLSALKQKLYQSR